MARKITGWTTQLEALGFLLDTEAMKISVPKLKAEELTERLECGRRINGRQRPWWCNIRRFQQLDGLNLNVEELPQ